MRLQLMAAHAALVAAAAAARADRDDEPRAGQGEVSTAVSLYADDDETRVLTTIVDGEVRVARPISLGLHALVDAVSSASVDVISAATTRWDETRVEAGARVAIDGPLDTATSLAFVRSDENDWTSNSLQLVLGRDVAGMSARLEAGYGMTRNDIGRADDPIFERDLDVHTAELGVRQLWSERTQLLASYTVQLASGYQASPYRLVTTMDGVFSFPESHPDRRIRHGLTVGGVRALGERTGWTTTYRIYRDDWGVQSHTVTSAISYEASERWDVRARGRLYYQGAADFYREEYESPARYMSADRELGRFADAAASLRTSWHAGPFLVDAGCEGIYYRFFDFARLAGRLALVATAGVGVTW